MRSLISTTLMASILSFAVSAAMAQVAPAPQGPSMCKQGEQYDATSKTCTVPKR